MPQIIKRSNNFIYVSSDEDVIIELFIEEKNVFKSLEVFTYEVQEVSFKIFNIHLDGVYKLIITIGDSVEEYTLPIFTNLINNVSREVCAFLCNNTIQDDCNECNDFNEKAARALKYNNLTSKLLYLEASLLRGYNDLSISNYNTFLTDSLNTISCKTKSLLNKILKEECLKGISENTELYDLIITSKFLGIFFLENSNIFNVLESDVFINTNEFSNIVLIEDQYLIENIKKCICNSCLRFEELESIFENGIDDSGEGEIIITNARPRAANVFTTIESSTDLFEQTLNPLWFTSVYNDDNTTEPISIFFGSSLGIFNSGIFNIVDLEGNIIENESIPFINIGNYKISGVVPTLSGSIFNIPFNVSDGDLSSINYTLQIGLSRTMNFPPTVISGFDFNLNLGNFRNFDFNEITTLGEVIDPEGDEITAIRFERASGLEIFIHDPIDDSKQLAIAGVFALIDLSRYSTFQTLFSIEIIDPLSVTDVVSSYWAEFSFRDSGSNTFSNDNNPLNVMRINVNPSFFTSLQLLFSKTFEASFSTDVTWLPIARVRYSSSINNLSISTNYINELGNPISIILAPATDDSVYNIYSNGDSVLIEDTTNPEDNTYDVFVLDHRQSDKTYNFRIMDNDNILNVQSLINIDSSIITNPLELPQTFQIENLSINDIDSVISSNGDSLSNFFTSNDTNVINVEEISQVDLNNGTNINIENIGLLGFCFKTDVLLNLNIIDVLGNDISSSFNIYFDEDSSIQLFISNTTYIPSNIFFKITFNN